MVFVKKADAGKGYRREPREIGAKTRRGTVETGRDRKARGDKMPGVNAAKYTSWTYGY